MCPSLDVVHHEGVTTPITRNSSNLSFSLITILLPGRPRWARAFQVNPSQPAFWHELGHHCILQWIQKRPSVWSGDVCCHEWIWPNYYRYVPLLDELNNSSFTKLSNSWWILTVVAENSGRGCDHGKYVLCVLLPRHMFHFLHLRERYSYHTACSRPPSFFSLGWQRVW